ncbi:hypothetical protein DPMN_122261 [Dreissena polymorpha]|uniref:Uncharacterized protein n=1 Tax=Dreissena polymorpha TaxID=45954 RepID=A0A9D4GV55_DREPO|nr:hypothetical protein DPMN_122261 [Dreissena polymorpha]
MMPVEPRCVIRDEPGLYRDSTGKVLKCLIPPGKTGNDRCGTGNNRDGTGNIRDGTYTDPGRATATRRWCPCRAPVNAGRVPV